GGHQDNLSGDPFAPWNQTHGASPNVFGELAEGGAHGGPSTSGEDYAENLRQITFSQVGADFQPDISRDGKWITFASTQHSSSSDLYIKPIGSHAVTRLTNDPGQDIMPSFSPDGRRIAFASNRDGSWGIYVMSVGGGQPVQITEGESHELHPTWSPDGRRTALAATPDGSWDLYVMGVGGGQPVQITEGESHELHPPWSPDGKHVAFCRLNPASNKWEIWVVDAMHTGVARFLGHGLF